MVLATACGPALTEPVPTQGSTSSGVGTTSGDGTTSSGVVVGSTLDRGTTSSGSDGLSSTTAVVVPSACDIFEQDCPQGYKCNPFSADGNLALDGARCVPVEDDPDGVGEPCSWESNGQDGQDSCVGGTVCLGPWRSPTCTELCGGTEAAPTCTRSDASCFVASETTVHLCLTACDPLGDPCEGGGWCLPLDSSFFCTPPNVGLVGNPLGSSCEYVNECEAGLLCGPTAPSLCGDEAQRCCLPPCDLGAPDCPGETVCEPWYEDPPPGTEHVGVCQDAR